MTVCDARVCAWVSSVTELTTYGMNEGVSTIPLMRTLVQGVRTYHADHVAIEGD